MSKKAVVKRITSEEDALIEVLRSHGLADVLTCLNTAISTLPPESSEFLRAARSALKPNVFISLTDLVNIKALTEDDANLLLTALSENRNIAVIGDSGSGRTTLLHALVCSLEETKRTCVVEPVQEMDFSVSAPNSNIVTLQSNSVVSNMLFEQILHTLVDHLVFGDIVTSGDVAAMTAAINFGQSVLFSAKVKDGDSVIDSLKAILGSMKPRLAEALDKVDLLVVRCSNDGETRTFRVE